MSTLTVQLEKEVSPDFLHHVMITAFDGNYGGCWYWAEPISRDWLRIGLVDGSEDPVWISAGIQDKEDPDEVLLVSHKTLLKGIQAILGKSMIRQDLEVQVVRSVLEGDPDIDADAADCIVQIGLFGELVYG